MPLLNFRSFLRRDSEEIGNGAAYCAKDAFELVLRQDKHKRNYLFALNPHIRAIREDQVILKGSYSQCVDLGIGSGLRVPATPSKTPHAFGFIGIRVKERLLPCRSN
jgi:hypothetical protein